jgi:hypothetical protein
MHTKGWIIFWIMFLFVAGAPAYGQADAETGPKVHLPQQQHDFEMAVEGVETVHDFVVQNVGSAELSILSVKAD